MKVWINQDLGSDLREEIAPDASFGSDDGRYYVKESAENSGVEKMFDGTANPAGPDSWEGVRAKIGAEIRAHLQSGRPAIAEASQTGREDHQVRAAVERLLEREVNPSIAAHGGKISIVALTNGVLSIAMSGGCQGCASSTATLRDGFETMARRVVPELTQIVDTTNHAAGAAPFYAHPSASNDDTSPLHRVQLSAIGHDHSTP